MTKLIALLLTFAVATCARLTPIAAMNPKANRCQQIRNELHEMAWKDPDAFDMIHLLEVGLFQYMCTPSEYSPRQARLCAEMARVCPAEIVD